MSTYIHYTNLGQRPIADLTAKRLLKKGARLAKKLNKKEDISQSEDKEDDELLKTMRVATAKMNLAKRVRSTRKQQKNRMDNLTKNKKSTPAQKKSLKRAQDDQIKQMKVSGAQDIKMIMKSGLWEDISQSDVDNLEKFADRILKKYNIDVEFTRHFVDSDH